MACQRKLLNEKLCAHYSFYSLKCIEKVNPVLLYKTCLHIMNKFDMVLLKMLCLIFFSGFIMMTPQLFINYKLKSVAHLPWRMLSYKFLNTFIDDIFAFVIKMPTMYRIGCFRDGMYCLFIFRFQWYPYLLISSSCLRGVLHSVQIWAIEISPDFDNLLSRSVVHYNGAYMLVCLLFYDQDTRMSEWILKSEV